MWWLENDFEVVFDPDATGATDGVVLVGLGNPVRERQQPGIVLNNKGAGPIDNEHAARSVSEIVFAANDESLTEWRRRLPAGAKSIRRIVVEDLSLDTSFALLLFFTRLENQAFRASDWKEWVAYVTAWEMGSYTDGADMRDSVSLLVTMLGHSFLAPAAVSGGDPASYKSGLVACLNFLSALLQTNRNPREAEIPKGCPEYARAISQFEYEYQQYRLALKHGVRCQLLVPLRAGGRRVLTDALILMEVEPSGILKIFARNDREHSWTKKGFGLLAIYRPSQAGTGNDMTISVDPDAGLTLKDLWSELERLENERWQGKRPSDAPRRITSYLAEGRQGLMPDAPNQPWWDDSGNYTLVGAPKAVTLEAARSPGTRLDWVSDVLGALWRCYRPIPPEASLEPPSEASDKQIAIVRWHEGSNLAVAQSPTFLSWLAACSMRRVVHTPLDLPSVDEFEVIRPRGGVVVFHREGVTLFDDWSLGDLDIDGLQQVATETAVAAQQYRQFMSKTPNPLMSAFLKQNELLSDKAKFRVKDFHRWKQVTVRDKSEMLRVLSQAVAKGDNYDQGLLRQALSRFWALPEQRAQVLETLDRIDTVTQQAFFRLKERRDRWLAAIVSGIGAGMLAKEIVESFRATHVMNAYSWAIAMFKSDMTVDQLKQEALKLHQWEIGSIVVVVAFFLIGFLAYWWLGEKIGKE